MMRHIGRRKISEGSTLYYRGFNELNYFKHVNCSDQSTLIQGHPGLSSEVSGGCFRFRLGDVS